MKQAKLNTMKKGLDLVREVLRQKDQFLDHWNDQDKKAQVSKLIDNTYEYISEGTREQTCTSMCCIFLAHTAQKIIQRIHTGIAKTKKKASDDMYAPIDSPISSLPKKARPNLEPIQSSWNESMPAQ